LYSIRFQVIKYKNFLSYPIHVSSGVPQGSHLFHLLFNIFINDITFNLQFAKLYSFDDDCKLLGSIKSIDDSYYLQNDITTVEKWSSLNLSKYCVISFYRKNNIYIFFLFNIKFYIANRYTY